MFGGIDAQRVCMDGWNKIAIEKEQFTQDA